MNMLITSIASLSLLLVAGGCGKKKTKDDPTAETPVAQPMPSDAAPAPRARNVTPQEALASVQPCWEGRGEDCHAPGVTATVVDPVPSAAEPGALIAGLRAAVPDLRIEPQLVLVNGNSVASVLLVEGTVKGDLWGQKAGGKKLSMYVAQVAQAGGEDKDGEIDAKVMRDEVYLDQATVLAQIGARASKTARRTATAWPAHVEVIATPKDAQQANFVSFNRGYMEAIRKQDPSGIVASYTPDAVITYVPEAGEYKGAKEIERRVGQELAASPDRKLSVRRQWGAGDWIVFESYAEGTLTKPAAGESAAKGKPWQSKRLELLEYRDGKISRHWIFANDLDRAVDLGLFEPAILKVAMRAPEPVAPHAGSKAVKTPPTQPEPPPEPGSILSASP